MLVAGALRLQRRRRRPSTAGNPAVDLPNSVINLAMMRYNIIVIPNLFNFLMRALDLLETIKSAAAPLEKSTGNFCGATERTER